MATIQPRVQVCLNADTKAIYDNAARAMGIPTSKLIANICADAAPNIVQLTELLNQAKTSSSPVAFLNMAKDLAVDARQNAADAQIHLEDVIAAHQIKDKPQEPPKPKQKPKAKPKA